MEGCFKSVLRLTGFNIFSDALVNYYSVRLLNLYRICSWGAANSLELDSDSARINVKFLYLDKYKQLYVTGE